ncbi:serine/threonine-protein kinase PknH-like [Hemicordylus capensis]|uniref:serine/threonine-protein kinase PknH-like n=1 Tax=Hemicordylus capensis TaxID=884348 RepID=UPI002304942F|nr:serine/threonine-protein kinase PknH-like [Hemicordylus capensis]
MGLGGQPPAQTASRGLRFALLRLSLVALLLLRHPALANVGSSAGSCKCSRRRSEPQIALSKLQACEACNNDLIKFTFPGGRLCGFKGDAWVTRWLSYCSREAAAPPTQAGVIVGAGAVKGPPVPAPTLPEPELAQPSPGPPEETPGTQPAPDVAVESTSAPGAARSTPAPSGRPAGAGLGQSPQQGEGEGSPPPAKDSRVAVLVSLGVALVSVAALVFVVCRRRGWRRDRPLEGPHPPGDAGEDALCLPGEET